MKKTSIIILSYNTDAYNRLCVDSIRQYTAPGSYEIIFVDNGSKDDSVKYLAAQDDVTLIESPVNLGFPGGCNLGLSVATGDYLLLLNSDIIVTENWLTNMLTALESAPDVGAVGCASNFVSNFQQIKCDYTNIEEMQKFAADYNKSDPAKWEPRNILVGFCFLFKREIYEKVGSLDNLFFPGNSEDDDYSFRIMLAGYRLLFCRDTFIHHFGSGSFARDNNKFKQQEKIRRYKKLLEENLKKFATKWVLSKKSLNNYRVMDNEKLLAMIKKCPKNLYIAPEPLISVIIPLEESNNTHNIDECIASVTAQNLGDIEIIITCPANSENCRELQAKYEPQKKVHFVFAGDVTDEQTILTEGFAAATGEYILFLDNTDQLAQNSLRNVYVLLKKFSLDIMHTTCCYYADEFGLNTVTEFKHRALDNIKLCDNLAENSPTITRGQNIYRRQFLQESSALLSKIVNSPLTISQDITGKFALLPAPYYITNTNNPQKIARIENILAANSSPVE